MSAQPVATVRERPILFSAPMVRAILAGKKTQTRRVMNPQPWYGSQVPGGPHFIWPPGSGQRFNAIRGTRGNTYAFGPHEQADFARQCSYGVRGDRLWVRETWKENEPPSGWIYRADGESYNDERPWRPSIFMPRRACRVLLEITAVRVQRLQEISEEDARAEGFSSEPMAAKVNGEPAELHVFDPVRWYALLWDAINGKRAPWGSNSWVWAITFRRVA